MSSWDEAFDFLLDQRFDNLFERRSAAVGREFFIRCKGCSAELTLPERLRHFNTHKRSRATARARATEAARARGLAAARKARRAKVG